MTTQGAKVILDVPANSKAIVPSIKKARDQGVIVIALDTPPEPQDAVDALFATDNLKAGELIGQYAKAKAEEMGITPKIAMLDLAPGISVGQLRHDGFLKGFGIKEGDPQIVGAAPTEGDRAKGQAAMESLLQKDSGINIIYSINEPSGFGGANALKAAGKDPEGLHPRLRRRWLRGDQEGHQDRRHRRHLAAVPAEDGGAGRGEGRGGRARRREALGLRRHRRRADHRPAGEGRRGQGRRLRRGELLGLVRPAAGPRERGRPRSRVPAERTHSMTQPQAQTAGAGGEGGGQSAPPTSGGGEGRAIPKVSGDRVAQLGPLIALLLACAFFTTQSDRFLDPANFSLIIQQVMVVGTLAIGQTLIILTAGIDLSCGTAMALGSIVMTKMAVDNDVPPMLAILLGVLTCMAVGFINGGLVVGLAMPPFIVTLGTFSICYALDAHLLQGRDDHGPPERHDQARRDVLDRRHGDDLRIAGDAGVCSRSSGSC